jgi:transglutaminase-like putative cysteine protease
MKGVTRSVKVNILVFRRSAAIFVAAAMMFVSFAGCQSGAGTIDRTFGKKKRPQVESEEVIMVVEILGRPLGYALEKGETGAFGARSSLFMDISLSRLGQEMKLTASGEWHDDEQGRLVSGSFSYNASSMSSNVTAEMVDNSIRYISGAAGYERTRWILWEEGAIGTAAAGIYVEDQLRAGEREFSFRTFDVEEGEFKTTRIVRLEAEPMEIDDRLQSPVVFETYEEGHDEPMSTTWLDEDYVHYKTVAEQMGLEFIMRRVTPEELAAMEFEPDFDLLAASAIPCKGYPEDISALREVTLRMSFEQMPPVSRDLTAPNQSVLKWGDGYIDLSVSRDTQNKMKMTKDQQAEDIYRQPGRYIQSTHPRILAVADSVREATGASGWDLARELSLWVGGYISNKNYGQGFASAMEVMDTRAGDCTEHSVLLTAVLRAAGIAARPAVGVIYYEGNFLGHMWTEVFVDYWRTLDALDPQTLPIRIRVAASGDERAFDATDMVRAYDVVAGMSVEVIDYSESGGN